MFFFFNDTATTEIYTLSLHDALPLVRNVDFPHVADVHVLQSGGETVYHAIDSHLKRQCRIVKRARIALVKHHSGRMRSRRYKATAVVYLHGIRVKRAA